MRLLLDTHALLWWLAGDTSLPADARAAIGDASNHVFFSAASSWEIATKYRLGKLPAVAAIAADLERAFLGQGFLPLAISAQHGQAAGALPGPHRDPFDRMLIAQSLHEHMTLVTNEAAFEVYGVTRLWET